MRRDGIIATGFLEALRGVLRGRAVGAHGDLSSLGGPVPPHARPAAVLVPIYEEPAGPGLVFVRRSEGLVPHSGQIAFPGGRRDEGEEELACALREAREEIALEPDAVEILGPLDRYATVTDYLVSPFVGRIRAWPQPLAPDPAEVASILTVPVAALLAPGTLRAAVRDTPVGPRTVNFFVVGDDVIWGATAAMLRQLLELAGGSPLRPEGEVPWDKVRW